VKNPMRANAYASLLLDGMGAREGPKSAPTRPAVCSPPGVAGERLTQGMVQVGIIG
jgi:hypothetical protein